MMQRATTALVAAAAALLAAGCDELQRKLPFDPAVKTGRLENGLTYYVRHNRRPRGRLQLRLVVKAGSVLEADDQQGLAHLLEHMAFNGTQRFKKQELVNYLESIGMRFGPDLNAYTSFDETVYKLQVPTADTQAVDRGFEILRDWAFGISNEGAEIDRERGVVIEEWRLGRGAASRLRDQQFPVLLHGSRYAERLPIGKPEVIESFEHDRLRDFYRDWYRPDLMAVVAVGDMPADTLVSRIRKTFGTAPRPDGAPERRDFPVPGHRATLVSVADDPEATAASVGVYWKHPVRELRRVADYRRELIESLASGMLSRRLQEMARRADAPFLSAHAYAGRFIRTREFFTVGARVKPTDYLPGLEAVLAEAERMRRFGFTGTELARMKAERMTHVARRFAERRHTESVRYASAYTMNFVRDTISPGVALELALHRALLPELTIDEVNAAGRDWLSESNRVVLLSGPERDEAPLPSEEEVRGILESVAAKALKPYQDNVARGPLLPHRPEPGRIVERRRIGKLGLRIWKLSNGARVMLKPTRFKKDEILVRAWSRGGHAMVDGDDVVPAQSAARVVAECGRGRFSRTQLQKRLAGRTVSLDPHVDELKEGVRGFCRPDDLEVLMQLLYLTFTSPRPDPGAFDALQQRMRTHLRNRQADPESAFWDTVHSVMASGHPRRRPWKPETVDAMDLGRSLALYQQRFANAADFTFLFVGRIDLDRLETLACRYIGGLPAVGEAEAWRDLGIRPPEGRIEKTVRRGLEPKSRVHRIYGRDFAWSDEQRYRVQSMTRILEIRLRERLRESMSGTYFARVYPVFELFPRERCEVRISFGCAPSRVRELLAAVDEEIALLQDRPVGAEYLRKVKTGQLKQWEVNRERNAFWAGVLEFSDWHGEDPLLVLELPRRVRALTAATIRDTARACFRTEDIATFILLPETPGAPQ